MFGGEKNNKLLNIQGEKVAIRLHYWINSQFHPDYQTTGKRTVAVGPNKGDTCQEGVARLLESKSMIRPDEVDLSKIDHETDVLVIGGGGAGTSAAIMAAIFPISAIW